jgi:FMN-dependent NADH-azoreductase
MTTLLYVEVSPRKERSYSIKVANAFLKAYQAANPDHRVDWLDLWKEPLPPFDGDMINAKYAVLHGQDPTAGERAAWGEIETLFGRFNGADKYVFSVPMWNFGIPYILKHYIDVITQPSLAFSFDPETGYAGLVSGPVALLYSSGGAYHQGSGAEAMDHQKPYLEAWLGFIGLIDVSRVIVAPTLAAPDEVDSTANSAIEEAARVAARF